MTRAAWSLCLALCACGDESNAPPPASRVPRGRPLGDEPARPTSQPAAPQPTTAPEPSYPSAPAPPPRPAAAQPQAQAQPSGPDQPEKPPRNYSAELLAAIGSPVECLKPREGENAPKQISVSLEAYFIETGAQSRSYASSSQLDAEELGCVKSRLAGVRLAGPIDEAPRAVSATLSFTRKASDTPPE